MMVHAGLAPKWTTEQAEAHAREVERQLQGPDFRKLLKNMYGDRPIWSTGLAGFDRIRASQIFRASHCRARQHSVEEKGALVRSRAGTGSRARRARGLSGSRGTGREGAVHRQRRHASIPARWGRQAERAVDSGTAGGQVPGRTCRRSGADVSRPSQSGACCAAAWCWRGLRAMSKVRGGKKGRPLHLGATQGVPAKANAAQGDDVAAEDPHNAVDCVGQPRSSSPDPIASIRQTARDAARHQHVRRAAARPQ